jgi:hypothetical protein
MKCCSLLRSSASSCARRRLGQGWAPSRAQARWLGVTISHSATHSRAPHSSPLLSAAAARDLISAGTSVQFVDASW